MHDIQQQLAHHESRYLQRVRRVFDERNESRAIVDGKAVVNFCGNDYLNLSTHDEVKKAFANSASSYGLGSSGSALISGYSKSHEKLERAFAEFLNRDRAILFNSGYHANLGVLTTFAGRNSKIIADKYCHASLNTGALLSRAKFQRYKHGDYNHAKELLEKNPDSNTLLVTESVFSMQGSISDIEQLSKIAAQYNAMLVVDDAHGIGVLGKNGAGVCEHFALPQQAVPCLVSPLGKAMGSYGAIVSGDESVVEALLQFADSYRYCTAIPPAICEATITVLGLIQKESWRQQKLLALCEFFLKETKTRNIKLASDHNTPIKCIVIGCNEKTLRIQQHLLDQGFLVSCIRPPTVPANKACLRISLCTAHEEQQIIALLDGIKQYE